MRKYSLDVKTFCEYFSDVSEKRKDKIYIPDNNGFYETNNMKFSTKPNNEVHDDKHLWDRIGMCSTNLKRSLCLYQLNTLLQVKNNPTV